MVAYSTFPKLEMVCDCSCHLILCAFATIGPMVDLNSFRRLLFSTLARVGVNTLLADAGYDTESNHRFARDGCRVRSVIPPLHGRPTDKLPSGPHRRLMKFFRDFRYGQRWQIETVVSMMKRNLGSFVAARSDRARSAEVMLKVLTHNLMIIAAWLIDLFYRAIPDPFEFPCVKKNIFVLKLYLIYKKSKARKAYIISHLRLPRRPVSASMAYPSCF
jgi:Transposase DDE domain